MIVSVVGARGYLGRELLRMLSSHPNVTKIQAISTSAEQADLHEGVPQIPLGMKLYDIESITDFGKVVFLATDAELATTWAAKLPKTTIVIDLSRAHRHKGIKKQDGWVYGAPGIRSIAPGATRIANPGCYPRATMLALQQLAARGTIVGPVIVDGKSATSGAGATPRADMHHPEQASSIRPYKVLNHDHEREMAEFSTQFGVGSLKFVPHLVPTPRGMVVTCYAQLDGYNSKGKATLPFGVTLETEVNSAYVRGCHAAQVSVDFDPKTGFGIARCAIDNLVQGGSGTAIQNMNDALGLPTHLGLSLWGVSP